MTAESPECLSTPTQRWGLAVCLEERERREREEREESEKREKRGEKRVSEKKVVSQ
jgi:hypothetical protein